MTANTAKPFLLNGQWVHTSSLESVRSPYSDDLLAVVCQAESQHIDQAIASMKQAASDLAAVPAHVKARALSGIAGGIAARHDEFSRTLSQEAGKPLTDARREIDRGIHTFRLAAEESTRIPGETIPMDLTPGGEPYTATVRRFPLGPVLGITPFNFPLNLVAHKVAPCLAAGNPIVLKPAPQTPLTSLLLGEVFLTTDLPPTALTILPCSNVLAERMVEHPVFQALSFTGSVNIGWMLKRKAGHKRVLLELGGNAGVIIEPDANLDTAVARCVAGGFGYAGQTCISVQRIFVHQSHYDRFLQSYVDKVRTLPMGDPALETTVVGPLINEQAAMRVEAWIQEAVTLGAHLHTGGRRHGSVMEATVLTHVSGTMKVCCEEIFGPVVTISPYTKLQEALDLMNDSPFGLQAGIFTKNIDAIYQAYASLEVGAVLVNEIPTFRADHMPYGGIKDSGLGREGVRYVIQELTEPKLLIVKSPS
ncbi:MAG: aldehyde dehydrogenase family protein [Nitrospirota bacterium]|nr:aldehyde dehydrogenase family protein [Nitrospirota bacterium]